MLGLKLNHVSKMDPCNFLFPTILTHHGLFSITQVRNPAFPGSTSTNWYTMTTHNPQQWKICDKNGKYHTLTFVLVAMTTDMICIEEAHRWPNPKYFYKCRVSVISHNFTSLCRLLHSSRLVALWLWEGYHTWHQTFVICWSKHRLVLSRTQWILVHITGGNYYLF